MGANYHPSCECFGQLYFYLRISPIVPTAAQDIIAKNISSLVNGIWQCRHAIQSQECIVYLDQPFFGLKLPKKIQRCMTRVAGVYSKNVILIQSITNEQNGGFGTFLDSRVPGTSSDGI